MPFAFPTFPEILYRLWRLRRLIACGVVFPVIIYVLFRTLGWLLFGVPVTGIVPFALVVALVVASHAVLFPNAMTETATVSVALAILVVASPLAGNSVLGWLVLLLFAFCVAVFGQNRLLSWQLGSPKSVRVMRASVRTKMPKDQVMHAFAQQPDRDTDDQTSGTPDADGVFPVSLKLGIQQIDEGLGEEFDEALEEAVRQNADEIRQEMQTLHDQDAFDDADDIDLEPGPSFWVKILEQTPDLQRAHILVDDDGPGLREHSMVEYRITPTSKGWIVTEIETVVGYEQGLSLAMWMTEFQKDRLVMIRDRLEQRPGRALRLQHSHGLLSLIGRAFMRRQLRSSMRHADADNID